MNDWSAALSAFHFMRPEWLLLFIPILFVIALAIGSKRIRQDEPYIASHLLQALTIKGANKQKLSPINIGLLGFSLSVMLLSGPTWQRQASPLAQDNAILVIALDLSNTMNQADVQPSRLERAKHKIADLLELRGNARTGLIAYAGSAHQVLPLSDDPELLLQFLDSLDTSIMPKQGKFPEQVLPIAKQMFASSAAPGSLLLIGDGVSPETLRVFEDYFTNRPHQLMVLGVGLEKQPEVPLDLANQQTTFGGAHLALQATELKQLSKISGGDYIELSVDKTDIDKLNNSIDHYLASVDEPSRPWFDAGYYLLFPIALIFALWFRRGWTLNSLVIALMLHAGLVPQEALAATSQQQFAQQSELPIIQDQSPSITSLIKNEFLELWLSPNQMGRFHFERGNYASAANYFRDPMWRGTAFYYGENFSAAIEMFRQVDSPIGRFNLANALAQGQHYVLAEKMYSEVLLEIPDHSSAHNNQRFIRQIIKEIDQMAESQRSEEGQTTRDLGDQPQRSLGADAKDIAVEQSEQLSAEQLLNDQQLVDMWMRQVQVDPRRFLRAKFQLQHYRDRTPIQAAENASGTGK